MEETNWLQYGPNIVPSVIPIKEMLWRFGTACFVGLVLGLDREAKGISAGVRTHMLVALSSAATMLVALELYEEIRKIGGDADPSRAIQGLAQAIGFLVAGVIFVSKGAVYGLTTAASLWTTSAVGIASGAGMYSIVLTAGGFALVIVAVLGVVTKYIRPKRPNDVTDDP